MDSRQLTGEHFNLKWNNYINNFIQVFAEHQNQEALVDVTLSCEGQYIKAHKLILSACSDYFHSIFQIHKNVPHPFILLNGIAFKDLKYILNFMYHGEVKVLDADLRGVLALGESLQVKGLSSIKLRSTFENGDGKNVIPQQNIEAARKAFGDVLSSFSYGVQAGKKSTRVSPKFDSKSEADMAKTKSQNSHNEVTTADPPLKKRITASLASSPEVPKEKSSETEINTSTGNKNNDCKTDKPNNGQTKKILRPPNAFMIFANEWRKKLAVEHPDETNKGISVKLGNMWKSLTIETKASYYQLARKASEEHKLKYPGYKYDPNKARKRKHKPEKNATECPESDDDLDPLSIVEIDDKTIYLSGSE